MFIRFVVGADKEHHRSLAGIFTEARMLMDDGQLSPDEEHWLEATFDWFNTNLPHPPFSSGTLHPDAVAWYKTDATEYISRMWDIVAVLREHDLPVRLLKSKNPVQRVYEDPYQVVVKEYRHLR